jgi:hypothetical protein
MYWPGEKRRTNMWRRSLGGRITMLVVGPNHRFALSHPVAPRASEADDQIAFPPGDYKRFPVERGVAPESRLSPATCHVGPQTSLSCAVGTGRGHAFDHAIGRLRNEGSK